jgi:hypothetical protein
LTVLILGVTAFRVEAGEIMPAVQVAMAAALSYTALRDLVLMQAASIGPATHAKQK